MSERDHRPAGLSREEIARQFELPERKSKIATLLKQDGQAYCVCRSSDSSRFMIGCDSCEEWYHGDCIGISQKEARYIKQYFCVRCKEEDPTLQTRFKPRGGKYDSESRSVSDIQKIKKKREKQIQPYEKKGKRPYSHCTNPQRENCGYCSGCREAKKLGRRDKYQQNLKYTKHSGNIRGRGKQSNVSSRKGGDSSSDGERYVRKVRGPHQCFGPGCVKQARYESKYCSDKCGVNLATNRIFQVLPQRIQEWSMSPCVAEIMNGRHLETIRKQQREVHGILRELDKRHLELDEILRRAKNATVSEEEEKEEEESEMSMYCITCGHEIHSRTAIRHMEKCFNKYESQASFGSIYKTRIEGNNMFCDYYNPANRTYCKRLRVLCPEHCKDPKVSDTEVCGCPLVSNVFNLTGEFCRSSKKSCIKHYCWEKLRRAEIDMERVRQWLKIDELIEQERQTRQRMSDRAGVLALMLHSTYNHELMEQMSGTP